MTEYEKMMAGEPFIPTDASILLKVARCYLLTRRLNRMSLLRQKGRYRVLKRIVGSIAGKPFYAPSPMHFEYGFNTHIGKNALFNSNLTIIDGAPVRIGDDVMIGPCVTLVTNCHPFNKDERLTFDISGNSPINRLVNSTRGCVAYAKPITIGNNVWICSGVIVCAGVTIGDNSIIGAGSVVTRDIPPNVLAYGSPCRVVREITEADRLGVREG